MNIFNPYEYDKLILRERLPIPNWALAEPTRWKPVDIFKPQSPAPECGTEAAYMRHRRHEEPIDEICRAYLTQRSRERRQAKPGWKPKKDCSTYPCGTLERYNHHRRNNEPRDELCRAAYNADRKTRRKKQ